MVILYITQHKMSSAAVELSVKPDSFLSMFSVISRVDQNGGISMPTYRNDTTAQVNTSGILFAPGAEKETNVYLYNSNLTFVSHEPYITSVIESSDFSVDESTVRVGSHSGKQQISARSKYIGGERKREDVSEYGDGSVYIRKGTRDAYDESAGL